MTCYLSTRVLLLVENFIQKKIFAISTNESTEFTTGHVFYNLAYTYKFQLKTTMASFFLQKKWLHQYKPWSAIREALTVSSRLLSLRTEVTDKSQLYYELPAKISLTNGKYLKYVELLSC